MILARKCSKKIFVNPTSFRYLSDIRFSRSHEYLKVEGDVGSVGITDHAAQALGDVVFVDLPSVGAKFVAGDSFGSVESVKAASDVYSPVSGTVIEINKELQQNPGMVNESPLEKGWFIKLRLDAQSKVDYSKLLNDSDYQNHLDETKH